MEWQTIFVDTNYEVVWTWDPKTIGFVLPGIVVGRNQFLEMWEARFEIHVGPAHFLARRVWLDKRPRYKGGDETIPWRHRFLAWVSPGKTRAVCNCCTVLGWLKPNCEFCWNKRQQMKYWLYKMVGKEYEIKPFPVHEHTHD